MAMTREPYSVVSGCELASRFLKQQGKSEEASQYQERGAKQAEMLAFVEQERATLKATDKLQPHQLPDAEIEALRQQIARSGIVSVAYWVRKEVTYLPEKPMYVLGIVPYASWQENREEGDESRFTTHLAQILHFPGEVYILVLSEANREIQRAMSQVEGALIYRAEYK